MQDYIKTRLADDEEKLMKLERQINPLLDDNDQNQLSFTLMQFMDKFNTIECKSTYIAYAFILHYIYVLNLTYLYLKVQHFILKVQLTARGIPIIIKKSSIQSTSEQSAKMPRGTTTKVERNF